MYGLRKHSRQSYSILFQHIIYVSIAFPEPLMFVASALTLLSHTLATGQARGLCGFHLLVVRKLSNEVLF